MADTTIRIHADTTEVDEAIERLNKAADEIRQKMDEIAMTAETASKTFRELADFMEKL